MRYFWRQTWQVLGHVLGGDTEGRAKRESQVRVRSRCGLGGAAHSETRADSGGRGGVLLNFGVCMYRRVYDAACTPRVGVSPPYSTPTPLLQQSSLSFTGGACYSWGWNEHGMCGDGTEANVWAPKPVQALWSSSGLLVGCGAGHSLALCHLPALPTQGQRPKVTGPFPDATEDAKSQMPWTQKETGKKDN